MSQFIQTFLTGGFMMWPLLAASIVTIAIAVERTVFYRRSASDMQVLQGEFLSAVRAKNFDAAAALCKKAGGTVGAVLETQTPGD